MAYNNNGGAEFQWNYSMGGNGMGQSYPQMSQMGGMGGGNYGGGHQWLHSNQSHAQPHGQHYQGHPPFEDYNQSMMRYTKVADGTMSQGNMGLSPMGGSYSGGGSRIAGGGGYAAGMSRNGLGNPSAGMGQSASGYGGSSW